MNNPATYTAFQGDRRITSGNGLHIALAIKAATRRGTDHGPILAFDDATARLVDFDLRGSDADIAQRLTLADERAVPDDVKKAELPRAPGRPKLGVVAREITLLPRHWEWLNRQSGGASVTLRKLVDAARAANGENHRKQQAREIADRFMLAMAGNQPGYEEAARALYAGNKMSFDSLIEPWPVDIRDYIRQLARDAFDAIADQGALPA
ncbi:DUF2239 family protein [Pseudolysobacter antarcticus]|uniref:DUF2239 family protein n=1 Tax=Pseudolysobacter antarcticus TaxID=2511995 RepID=A0A411HF81_9GAMM|nr:DUF2239 family protein [Pseudolysobacter antarcticus]QBB69131.1 DUF2239 family protein [Pseudolysobacter antarcticus]